MKFIYLLSAILFSPLFTFAHDGEHITTVWYQDTPTLISALIVAAAVCALAHSLFAKQKKFMSVSALVLVVALIAGVTSFNQSTSESKSEVLAADFGSGQSVTLYKSPNCGCCSGHAKALEQAGFDVTIEETDDLALVKKTHNIPSGGESCHTSIIGDYVVEGHVPLEAIEKLLAEKPDIVGIGLAGMPIGTPGMPGRKTAPYEVYQLSDGGEVSPYVNI